MKYNFMGTTYQYNDTGSATDKIENLPILMGKLLESITPGSIDRLFDYTKTAPDEEGNFTGYRVSNCCGVFYLLTPKELVA